MNFLFNIEAGDEIGLGHFYRSVSVARVLKEKGHFVVFIFKPTRFWIKEIENGFEFDTVQIISDEYTTLLKSIEEYKIQIFYFDGFKMFNEIHLDQIKLKCKVVFYQNNSESRFLSDLFIQPSSHMLDDYYEGFSKNAKIIQGLQYFVVNEKVKALKPKTSKSLLTCATIGVISGGTDPTNSLVKVYRKLDFNYFKDVKFVFFYGTDYPFMYEIPQRKLNNVCFELYNIDEIYKSDLLISAFGVSTYEFLALGLPTVCFGHQISNAKACDYISNKYNAAVSLGYIDDVSDELFNYNILKVIQDKEMRECLSKNAKNLIDFKGSQRVAEILEKIND